MFRIFTPDKDSERLYYGASSRDAAEAADQRFENWKLLRAFL